MLRVLQVLIVIRKRISSPPSASGLIWSWLTFLVLLVLGLTLGILYNPFRAPTPSEEFQRLRPRFEIMRRQVKEIADKLPPPGTIKGDTRCPKLNPRFYLVSKKLGDGDRKVQRSMGRVPSLTNADCMEIEAIYDPRASSSPYFRYNNFDWCSQLDGALLMLVWTEEEFKDYDPHLRKDIVEEWDRCATNTRYVVLIRKLSNDESPPLEGFVTDLETREVLGSFVITPADYAERTLELSKLFRELGSDRYFTQATQKAIGESILKAIREITDGIVDW